MRRLAEIQIQRSIIRSACIAYNNALRFFTAIAACYHKELGLNLVSPRRGLIVALILVALSRATLIVRAARPASAEPAATPHPVPILASHVPHAVARYRMRLSLARRPRPGPRVT